MPDSLRQMDEDTVAHEQAEVERRNKRVYSLIADARELVPTLHVNVVDGKFTLEDEDRALYPDINFFEREVMALVKAGAQIPEVFASVIPVVDETVET